MLSGLQTILISVLEFFYGLIGSYEISLILLSAFVSLVLAPLYHLTGILEKKERVIKLRLAMYKPASHRNLNELYEQFGYWPFYSIRSLASLFIQIPILIAAYNALKDYAPLKDSWLGYPDNFLSGFNLFPFAMTLINLCAVFISSEPESKERRQGIFIAMIFFFLLYTSPSALLVYWTCNQLFTLIRYLKVYQFPKINRPNFNFKLPFSIPNLQTVALNISVMTFPAILIYRSNEIYFDAAELAIYATVLLSFSVLISFISSRTFSVSLILSLMFLPMVRDITHYITGFGVSLAVFFATLFVFTGSIIKQKGAIIAFCLIASLYALFFIENANSNFNEVRAKIEIPQELTKLELKDSASIYLFMQDGFPHKDYAEYLDFQDYEYMMNIFRQNDFKIYDVYSTGFTTLSTMSSLFAISTDFLPKQDGVTTPNEPEIAKNPGFGNVFHSGYLRAILNGNNITNTLLQKNGYKTAILSPHPYDATFFRGNRFYDFIYADSAKNYENRTRNQVLRNIAKGTLNSDLAHDSSFISHLLGLAKFVQNNSEKTKIFMWGSGCPSHATKGGLGSTEKELERFLPRYTGCLKTMKEQIEMIKSDSNAIIIFMSDHGGYFIDDGYLIPNNYDFNKTDYMKFRDVFGAFMAVRWPNKEKAEKYDENFNISQDLFPIIFAYLFDSEVPLKYKLKSTEVRIGPHKFDKGIFYSYFYSGGSK